MRAYRVSAQPDGTVLKFKVAGSQADAKIKRDELIEELGVKKKDVIIEEIDIPTSKAELLDILNEHLEEAYEYGQNSQDDSE